MSTSNLQKLISSYLREDQRVADGIDTVYRARFLDLATGVQLDGLGGLVGAARLGANDAQYRIMIRTQIRVNLSSGTYEDLLAVFAAALPTHTLEITEFGDASAEFEATLAPAVEPELVVTLRSLLQRAKAAGV